MAHQGYLPLESDDNEICWGPFGGHEWKGTTAGKHNASSLTETR